VVAAGPDRPTECSCGNRARPSQMPSDRRRSQPIVPVSAPTNTAILPGRCPPRRSRSARGAGRTSSVTVILAACSCPRVVLPDHGRCRSRMERHERLLGEKGRTYSSLCGDVSSFKEGGGLAVTLKMTLSRDLVKELGAAVQPVPTHMGPDVALAVVSALGPSLTVVTTTLFSSETFREALHRWCKHSRKPFHISAQVGPDSISIDLGERAAPEMAAVVSAVVAKFLAIHPDAAGGSAPTKP
jgi:hypothetical protein